MTDPAELFAGQRAAAAASQAKLDQAQRAHREWQAQQQRTRDATLAPADQDLMGWSMGPDMRVTANRDAEFWTAEPDGRVSCTLCWRNCQLEDGQAGWCKIRRNEGGTLRIPEHGVLACAAPSDMGEFFWRYQSRMVALAGVSCTSACSFCTSGRIALAPERLEWALGEQMNGWSRSWSWTPHETMGWSSFRAMLHPAAAVRLASQWECSGLYFSLNEPLLTYEWTLDTARLAKQAGLFIRVDSNGFASPVAIRGVAPFVDAVYLGVKGHADPEFYARRMRSDGAVPHVLEAARTWRETGITLCISDVIPPPHWLDDRQAAEEMRRFYTWIAEELGPLVPVHLRIMLHPQRRPVGSLMLPSDPSPDDEKRQWARAAMAGQIARECGLRYVADGLRREILCHHCGGVLIGRLGRPDFDLHVSPDGHCDHCGGAVPIVGISHAEHEEIKRQRAAEK